MTAGGSSPRPVPWAVGALAGTAPGASGQRQQHAAVDRGRQQRVRGVSVRWRMVVMTLAARELFPDHGDSAIRVLSDDLPLSV
ncbi:hypothetical protein Cde04nite_01760 [Cellulomonas denverensis]|nr:hypothetical protein Cde04nite_01760 [Cellulomonas denverensis]